MRSSGRGSSPLDRRARDPSIVGLEAVGLALALGAFALLLVTRYSVLPLSDPAQWFAFGRDFASEFSSRKLAYGFPLLLSGAIALVGPYRGFLVNLPVLLLLGLALYGWARSCARHAGGDGAAPASVAAAGGALAGALALGLFVHLDPTQIIRLANPYRDPLAFLGMLASGILVLRFASGRSRSLAVIGLAGALLAFAGSTRETSVLFLAPLLLFAGLSRRRDPGLPFWRATFAFAAGFLVASIPYLVQNHLVSGSALVPAQAGGVYEESGTFIPGIRLGFLPGTLPGVLRFLAGHYGPGVCALIGLGAVAALRRRNLAIAGLCLPALVVYTLFYGSYDRVVPRYLLVVDLFALPIAGAGAAFLLEVALARVAGPGRIGRAVVALGFALAVGASLLARAEAPSERVRASDIERFVTRVRDVIPDGARVLGGRPAIDLMFAFLPNPVTNIVNLTPSRRLEDPGLSAALRRFVGQPGETWFVSRIDAARAVVQRDFDLVGGRTIRPGAYGLSRPLQGDFEIFVDRVAAWERRAVLLYVVARHAGPNVLMLDLGHISQHARTFASVYLGDRLLDEHPSDGLNFYEVEVATASLPIPLRIRSDRPLPSRPTASLRSARKKLTLDFEQGGGPGPRGRLSASLRERPKLRYPTLERAGTIVIPTLSPSDAAFLVDVEVDLPAAAEPYTRVIEAWVGGRRVYLGRRKVQPAASGSDVFTLSFTLPGEDVRRKDTPLELRLERHPEDAERRLLAVHSVSVRRQPLGDRYVLDFAAGHVSGWLLRGFHARRAARDRGAPPGRWTGPAASARLFLREAPGPARLEVVYWTGARPEGLPPPAPRFRIGSYALAGETRRERRDGGVRVVETFELPAAWALGPAAVLEIRATPWVPREAGVSNDPRSLGVRVESISLEREPPAAT